MRVVSLLPSATELVCALGHSADLVGRSAECDFPPAVRSLPIVMAARAWDADAPSAAIDKRVSAARGRGESLYTLNVPLLRELRPEVLLTQDLCGVCSVTGDEVRAACDEAGIRPEVVSLTPRSLEDVWESARTVGAAVADPSAGVRLSESLRRRATGVEGSRVRPRVAVLEWLDPPIIAGLWTPEMIAAAGGESVLAEPRLPGVRCGWTDIAHEGPDLVLLSPCSFTVERTQRELEQPSVLAGLASLTPQLGTFVADEAYFSRPGPRLADGIDLLRHLISQETWSPPMPIRAYSPEGIAT
jgi:iron complex transport system substrate-binding protein